MHWSSAAAIAAGRPARRAVASTSRRLPRPCSGSSCSSRAHRPRSARPRSVSGAGGRAGGGHRSGTDPKRFEQPLVVVGEWIAAVPAVDGDHHTVGLVTKGQRHRRALIGDHPELPQAAQGKPRPSAAAICSCWSRDVDHHLARGDQRPSPLSTRSRIAFTSVSPATAVAIWIAAFRAATRARVRGRDRSTPRARPTARTGRTGSSPTPDRLAALTAPQPPSGRTTGRPASQRPGNTTRATISTLQDSSAARDRPRILSPPPSRPPLPRESSPTIITRSVPGTRRR